MNKMPIRQLEETNCNRTIAALFVSGRSIYKHLPNVEAYDSKRNALTFDANCPGIFHPPCRCWSHNLRTQAKPTDRTAEMYLGRWAVETIHKCGGVLEHPARSHLFEEMNLPMPNEPAKLGFTIYIEQSWFGFTTKKATWLYVVGVPIARIKQPMFKLTCANSPGASHAERSRTMPALAKWLCEIARSVKRP
jgi:hypothetical protein